MRTKTKTLTALAVAGVLGASALAGATYAGHRDGGFDRRHGHALSLLDKGQLAVSAMELFDAIDTDGDGKLTQAEVDALRNARHATHDANGDDSLSLEEFAALWHQSTRPLTVRAFQMLDTDGDALVSRAEYDRPLADIVAWLDRDGDGALSVRDRWHDDDDHDGGWDDD